MTAHLVEYELSLLNSSEKAIFNLPFVREIYLLKNHCAQELTGGSALIASPCESCTAAINLEEPLHWKPGTLELFFAIYSCCLGISRFLDEYFGGSNYSFSIYGFFLLKAWVIRLKGGLQGSGDVSRWESKHSVMILFGFLGICFAILIFADHLLPDSFKDYNVAWLNYFVAFTLIYARIRRALTAREQPATIGSDQRMLQSLALVGLGRWVEP